MRIVTVIVMMVVMVNVMVVTVVPMMEIVRGIQMQSPALLRSTGVYVLLCFV
jgi:hypothetical protein